MKILTTPKIRKPCGLMTKNILGIYLSLEDKR
jgi:hypothetical protein